LPKNEPLVKKLLQMGAETDILLDNLYQITVKQLSDSCQALLRDWHAQEYGEYAEIIRNPSLDHDERQKALNAVLKSASDHRQPEVHALFLEMAEGLAASSLVE